MMDAALRERIDQLQQQVDNLRKELRIANDLYAVTVQQRDRNQRELNRLSAKTLTDADVEILTNLNRKQLRVAVVEALSFLAVMFLALWGLVKLFQQ